MRLGILKMTNKPLVSSDLLVRPESLVIAALQVQVMCQRMVRIFSWYDNEWIFWPGCMMLRKNTVAHTRKIHLKFLRPLSYPECNTNTK